jgi:hypothetical protein
MTLPNLDPSRSAELLFGDIMAYVDAADAMLQKREPLLLAGLDTAVEALCKRVMDLKIEEAKEYAPELEHLMARITQLQTNMVTMQDEIAATLQSVGVQKKANLAYNKPKPEA